MQRVPTLVGIAIGAGIAIVVPVDAVADSVRADGEPPGTAVVQLTPVGQTTQQPGATDSALLIGVSVAAVAGGAGLFAAARHAARRAG